MNSSDKRPLVLCFDGTSDHYDCDNTNVVKFFRLLKKDDFNQQLCYYQPGIGTWYEPGMVSPFFRWGAKLLDLAFAWYFDVHVMEGYKFIMKNYRVGDRICIFGFSRGAFTARALAGLLHKAGLLPRDNEQQVPFAYNLYKRLDESGKSRCKGFKQTFCQHVKVEFVGVWDTVSSVGMLLGKTLPPTDSNDGIKTFRHALALDEHRARFNPEYSHFKRTRATPGPVSEFDTSKGKSTKSGRKTSMHSFGRPGFFSRLLHKQVNMMLTTREDEDEDTDVLEVWFAGCHADVGGGAVLDKEKTHLSNVSLKWMVREVQKSNCGILFDEEALELFGITPYESAKAESEEVAVPEVEQKDELKDELRDELSRINDRLKENWLWWIAEIFPYRHSWYDKDQKPHRGFRYNFGRGRRVPHDNPIFHKSVQKRRDHKDSCYEPKATKWQNRRVVYVE